MTERELKKSLKSVYKIEKSEKEKRFLRQYEKRKMRYMDVILLEARYMGIKSMIAGVILTLAYFLLIKTKSYHFMWTMGAVIPLAALLPVISLGSSERYAMNELEMSSRFSLRFVKMIRMFILGVFSSLILFVSMLIVQRYLQSSLMKTLFFISFPYFFQVCFSLWILRKWHMKENIYGCIGVTGISTLLPEIFILVEDEIVIPPLVYMIFLLLILFVTGREVIKYVKESEKLIWNFV